MSFEFIKKLPTPQEIREKYPLSEELAAIKKARDEEKSLKEMHHIPFKSRFYAFSANITPKFRSAFYLLF